MSNKQMLCSNCQRPVSRDKDRVIISTFCGGEKRTWWYCPTDCGSGGLKGILGKARRFLKVG